MITHHGTNCQISRIFCICACSSIRLVLRLGRISWSDGVKVLLLGLASVRTQPPALRAPTHSNDFFFDLVIIMRFLLSFHAVNGLSHRKILVTCPCCLFQQSADSSSRQKSLPMVICLFQKSTVSSSSQLSFQLYRKMMGPL